MSAAFGRCLLGITLGASLACGGSSSHGSGGVDQSCYPNGTCNVGLSCFSNVCVQYDGGILEGGGPTEDAALLDGETSGEGGTAPTAAQAASAYAQAECNQALACLGAPVGYPDVATCVNLVQSSIADELTAPGNMWTPSQAMACANALSSATCTDYLNGNYACIAPVGTLATGAPCEYATQCLSDACGMADDSVCGVCVVPTGQGSTCENSGTCAGALFCTPDGQCEPIAGPGESCTQESNINFCAYPLTCIDGTCTNAGTGASCSPTTDFDCASYLFCTTTDDTCQPFTWAPPGGTCGSVAGNGTVWRECITASTCPIPSGGETATCPSVAEAGQACNATSVCLYPYICSSAGICTWTPASACK